jgi:hypothetical protein
MEESGKNLNKEDVKNKSQGLQGISSQKNAKPEHHLTCDVHIRERGHKSETETHCPKKDTNMQTSDIHDKK